jgi:hypothetical protein
MRDENVPTRCRRKNDAGQLAWLRYELGEDFVCGVLFHTGPRVFQLDERMIAAPISALWSSRLGARHESDFSRGP